MQTMAMAFPIPPAQLPALRDLAADLVGPRGAEFRDFLSRLKTREERWYIQTIKGEPHCVMILAAEDLGAAFGQLAGSQHPFDVWMKRQNSAIFGIDFERPSDDPMPEAILEVCLDGADA